VAELVGEGDKTLLVGRATNLKRWFATRLGQAPVVPGRRPPTDLTPVARALRFVKTTSAFGQRLAYERMMAARFPGISRRDLKPPAYVGLDGAERFPRVVLHSGGGGRPDRFGPFRDRASADKAVHALHKLFPLRPCDYTFEPHPDLPMGVGCLYAQVRSCAAPCLVRVTEEAYRALAAEAARFLAVPGTRPPESAAWLPAFVTAAATRGVVVEAVRKGFEIYAIAAGVVADAPVVAPSDALDPALASLPWPEAEAPGRDERWLTSWLYERKRKGVYVIAPEGTSGDAIAANVRAAFAG
jgi:hypothetical protein